MNVCLAGSFVLSVPGTTCQVAFTQRNTAQVIVAKCRPSVSCVVPSCGDVVFWAMVRTDIIAKGAECRVTCQSSARAAVVSDIRNAPSELVAP